MSLYHIVGVAGLACCLASGAASSTAPPAEEPIFRIGTKSYTLADLTGKTEEAFLQQTREDLKPKSFEELFKKLTEEHQRTVQELPQNKQRAEVERLLCRRYLQPLVRHAFFTAYFAAITERVVAEHAIDLDEYFDTDKVRLAIRRGVAYRKYLCDSPDDPAADERLLEDMKRTLKIQWPLDYWRKTREEVRKSGTYGRWESLADRGKDGEQRAVLATLAHALFEKACTEGIYYRRAIELGVVEKSRFLSYTITGYHGDRARLEEILRAVIKDGILDEVHGARTKELVTLLRQVSPGLHFSGSQLLSGNKLIHGYSHVPIGQVMELPAGEYLYYHCVQRAEPAEVHSITRNNFAYPLAGLDYSPEVVIYARDLYPLDPVEELKSLPTEGMMVTAGLEMGIKEYRRKPYPAEAFAQHRDCQAAIQSAVFAALTAHYGGDSKAAAGFVTQLRQRAEQPGPKPIQEKYRQAADALAERLKDKSPPKP